MNLTNNWERTQMLRKDKQLQLRMWHPSCYSYYKLDDKS